MELKSVCGTICSVTKVLKPGWLKTKHLIQFNNKNKK